MQRLVSFGSNAASRKSSARTRVHAVFRKLTFGGHGLRQHRPEMTRNETRIVPGDRGPAMKRALFRAIADPQSDAHVPILLLLQRTADMAEPAARLS
jgi:hypothetical protein